ERLLVLGVEEVDAARADSELESLTDRDEVPTFTAHRQPRAPAVDADERLAAHRLHELDMPCEWSDEAAFGVPQTSMLGPDSRNDLLRDLGAGQRGQAERSVAELDLSVGSQRREVGELHRGASYEPRHETIGRAFVERVR